VVKINIDYNGLSPNFEPRAAQVLNKIVYDPTTNMLIDAQTKSLTINFRHMGANVELGTTANDLRTITFNLDRLSVDSNGELVFST
jgi:hypothetical protein